MYKYKITVFTPTYNRAYILKNVYLSLAKQKFDSFEWLVINDGSTDNTDELMNEIQANNNRFEIRYIKKENGGKHTAINKAIEQANGEYMMVVDSDDYLTDNALEIVDYWIQTILNETDIFCGVVGLRCNSKGTTIGHEWTHKNKFIDINMFDRKRYKLDGDKAEVFKTDVLKKYYPIPVYKSENNVEEGLLWNRIANAGYLTRYFNEQIYICEYLEDGLTFNRYRNWLNNFNGFTIWMKELFHSHISLFQKLKVICMYTLLAEKKKISLEEISKRMNTNKLVVILSKTVIEIYHKRIARKNYKF